MSSSDTVMTEPSAVANVDTNDHGSGRTVEHDESSRTNPHPDDNVLEESKTPSTTMATTQLPPRRDKFASMAAAAAAVDSHHHNNNNNNHSSSVAQGVTTTTTTSDDDDPSAAATDRTQQQLKKRCLELCTQRDSVWDDCDRAEQAVTDLLQIAARTATYLSQQTKVVDDGARQEQLRQLIQEYQATVVQVHDVLAPHAHLVQAYQNHHRHRHHAPPRQTPTEDHHDTSGDGSSTILPMMMSHDDDHHHHHSVYTQRVEHRLAETKRQLLQDLIALQNDAEVPTASSSSFHPPAT